MAIGLRSDAGLISERTPTLSPIDLARQAASIARLLGDERQAHAGAPRYHLYQRQCLRIRVHAYWPDLEGALIVESHGAAMLRLSGEEVSLHRPGEWEAVVESLARLAAIKQRQRAETAGRGEMTP